METSRIDALVERGEEQRCLNLSDLSELVQELELGRRCTQSWPTGWRRAGST